MTQDRPDTLLKVSTVAERLDCHRSHVYKLIEEGKLDKVLIASKRGIRVTLSSLERFIEQNRAELRRAHTPQKT